MSVSLQLIFLRWLSVSSVIAGAFAGASLDDVKRATTRVPGALYRGDSFSAMNEVLNKHLQRIPFLSTRPCNNFTAMQLQTEVLEPIFGRAEPQLLAVYALHNDNRQRSYESLKDQRDEWQRLNKHVDARPELHIMQRDGLCHEAVMWFVHHLSYEHRRELSKMLVLPLLPTELHEEKPLALTDLPRAEVHRDYRSKVSCQQCHTGPISSDKWRDATLPAPLPVDAKHPGLERLRQCDYQADPPCGPCEGLGGPRSGDGVEEFTPVNCTVVAQPEHVPESARPKPAFPSFGHASISGESRSPLAVRPDGKKGKYPTVDSTISLAWDASMARHRYDFKKMLFGQPAAQIYLQSTGMLKSQNSTGVMVTIIGQEHHVPSLCICMAGIAGVMHIDSFVAHEEYDRIDLPPDEGGVKYLGRIKLAPIDGGEHQTVIADHYMKWAFHFLVDADTNSTGYGLPLRLYGPLGARFVYYNWTVGDPRMQNPDLFKIPKHCISTTSVCSELRMTDDMPAAVQFV